MEEFQSNDTSLLHLVDSYCSSKNEKEESESTSVLLDTNKDLLCLMDKFITYYSNKSNKEESGKIKLKSLTKKRDEVNVQLQESKDKKEQMVKCLKITSKKIDSTKEDVISSLRAGKEKTEELLNMEKLCEELSVFKINPEDYNQLKEISLKKRAYERLVGLFIDKNSSDESTLEGLIYNSNNNSYMKLFSYDLDDMTEEQVRRELWKEIENGCSQESLNEMKKFIENNM